ncbi:hypothetical protein Q5752_004781 [Cryptotrichosporon argae]
MASLRSALRPLASVRPIRRVAARAAIPALRVRLYSSPTLAAGAEVRPGPALSQTNRAEATLRRFWKTVHVKEEADGFIITLDHRNLKTPGGKKLVVPKDRRLLALLIANEWENQDEVLKQHALPLTSLASRALDGLQDPVTREGVVDALLQYLETDTICYPHDEPSQLVRLQDAHWSPLLSWLEATYGIRLNLADGLAPASQAADSVAKLRALVAGMDGWELAAFERAVYASKSFVIALALVKGQLGANEAAEAAHVEVRSQIEQWGEVEDTHDVDYQDIRRALGSVACFGVKTTVSSSSLPTRLTDALGAPANPLAPLDDYRRRSSAPVRAPAPPLTGVAAPAAVPTKRELDAEWSVAVKEGTVPDTPLARQVFETWHRFPGCIVLTRVGKFYESYFGPAHELSALLSLKLGSKAYKTGKFAFAGFQTAQLDKYLGILVRDLGHTVVLVEEYDDDGIKREPSAVAAPGESISRKVGRVVTPGTVGTLDEAAGESRYLLSLALGRQGAGAASKTDDGDDSAKVPVSLAYADVSTGEFFTKDTTLAHVEDELARIAPREVILDQAIRTAWDAGAAAASTASARADLLDLLRVLGVHVSFADPAPSHDPSLSVHTLAPFGEQAAINLLRHHLSYAFRDAPPALQAATRQAAGAQMQIDAATLQCLEIRHAFRPGGLHGASPTASPTAGPLSTRGSLLSVLGRTVTPSGHRLLVRTLTAPSTDVPTIERRLALVAVLVARETLRTDLRDALAGPAVPDVVRLVQKFAQREGAAAHVWDVARWVRAVERILARIKDDVKGARRAEGSDRLRALVGAFRDLGTLARRIEDAVDENAVMRATEDDEADAGDAIVAPAKGNRRQEKEAKREERDEALWWIKPGFSPALQAAHDALASLRAERSAMQAELREKHGADGLVLERGARAGYVVGVSKKAECDALKKSKRFETVSESGRTFAYLPWSTLGAKMDAATDKLLVAQRRAFDALRATIVERAADVQHNAELVDELDLAMSFAHTAVELNYVRPVLTTGTELHIVNGRHPAVESGLLAAARAFTPNSTHMTARDHLHVITGPNQGGKSTLLRQTAVLAILAQAGSFVPADAARIGVVDKVFSRVGARDDLFRDRSTFMLEMVETAAILRGATDRSLVIMDEIGRGTTLHAGVSIAYATLDYILAHIKCRTLFATHYHELGDMLCGKPDSTLSGADARVSNSNGEHAGGVHKAAGISGDRLAVRGTPRQGVSFWCTDVDEMDGAFAYSYRLQPGINRQSHAIKAAQLAGMPPTFLQTARATLAALRAGHEATVD